MTINIIKIKFLGKTAAMYRILNSAGEVLQVFESKAEAEAYINAI